MTSSDSSPKSPSEPSALDSLRAKTESFARENPTQALSSAFGIGLVLALLPLGSVISGLFRLLFLLLRPILIVLGLVKLYEELGNRRPTSVPPNSEGPNPS